jgi:hypothetical protein
MERALFAEQYAQATRDSMRRFGGRQWNELLVTVQVQPPAAHIGDWPLAPQRIVLAHAFHMRLVNFSRIKSVTP